MSLFTILILVKNGLSASITTITMIIISSGLSYIICIFSFSTRVHKYKFVVLVANAFTAALILISVLLTLAPKDILQTQNGLSQILSAVFTGLCAVIAAIIAYSVIYNYESNKRDREIIQNLNQRYSEIISRMSSGGEPQGDITKDNSFNFLALVALYKDWDTLSANSPVVSRQKDVQQNFIFKTIFNSELSKQEGKYAQSAIDEILPSTGDKSEVSIDTSNAFFSYLKIRDKNFDGFNFEGSSIMNVEFINCTFINTNFKFSDSINHIIFENCVLKKSNFDKNFIELQFIHGTIEECTFSADSNCKSNKFTGQISSVNNNIEIDPEIIKINQKKIRRDNEELVLRRPINSTSALNFQDYFDFSGSNIEPTKISDDNERIQQWKF